MYVGREGGCELVEACFVQKPKVMRRGGGRMYLLKWGTVIEQRKECSYDLAGYMERRTGGIGDGLWS